MAVQPRRSSSTRKNKRRTHKNLTIKGMVECPDCGEMKLSHRICRNCGSYKGETVVEKN